MKRAAWALALLVALTVSAQDPRRSGFDFMGASTQALQRDDTLNPAFLWIKDGEARWARSDSPSSPSCASCHGDAAVSMRGVAARHPAWDEALKRPLNLAQRINVCRERRQGLPPLAYESEGLLALEAFVGHQSRGLPLAPPADARLAPQVEQGRRLYSTPIGQLDLACHMCHDRHAGQHLAGNAIPQAHATAYPLYRLEWQGLGSLQRRLRNCMTGVRAEPYAFGAPEFVALELYLARRAAGMIVETPGVRP